MLLANNMGTHLIFYIHFAYGTKIMEDLHFYKILHTSRKTQDFFEIVNTFIIDNNLK